MTPSHFASIGRWARRAAWAGLVAVLVLPLTAMVADLAWGAEVLLIAPHDPSMVALNRSLWVPGDPVADLYGSPMSAPARVLLTRRQRVIHPQEDSTLSLLPVVEGRSRPLQTQTLWWGVRLGLVGLAAWTALATEVAFLARRRQCLAAASDA